MYSLIKDEIDFAAFSKFVQKKCLPFEVSSLV